MGEVPITGGLSSPCLRSLLLVGKEATPYHCACPQALVPTHPQAYPHWSAGMCQRSGWWRRAVCSPGLEVREEEHQSSTLMPIPCILQGAQSRGYSGHRPCIWCHGPWWLAALPQGKPGVTRRQAEGCEVIWSARPAATCSYWALVHITMWWNVKYTQVFEDLVSKVQVSQLCPTLCNPMDYTVPGIL